MRPAEVSALSRGGVHLWVSGGHGVRCFASSLQPRGGPAPSRAERGPGIGSWWPWGSEGVSGGCERPGTGPGSGAGASPCVVCRSSS